MKKLLAWVLALTMVLTMTSALAQTPEKTVITFWNGFTGTDGGVLTKLTEQYNATNDQNVEVKMEIMSWDSLYQKLATTLPVGEGPDIFAFNTERIGAYAEAGSLAVLNDLYESGAVDASLIPPGFEANLKFKGDYYGVPCDMATLLMFYNKDMFEAAGLDPNAPPTTWDQLEEYAKKLTRTVDGEQQYGFGMATNNTIPMWPIMIWGGGGDFIGQDGASVFGSEANVQTVTRWSKLIREDGIAPAVMTGAEIDTLFSSGKLGMYFCGPWATGIFDGAGLNYGIAAPPAGPAGDVTLGTGVAMVMNAATAHRDAVYDYFKFWNSADTQIQWSLEVGYPLARTDAASDQRIVANANVSVFSSVSGVAKFYLQQLTNFAQIDEEVIIPALENILLTGADVKTTLEEAQAQMNLLLGK